MTHITQFLLSAAFGCVVFAVMDGEPMRVRLLGAFLSGVGAAWFTTWAYVRLRFGRGARISMDMR